MTDTDFDTELNKVVASIPEKLRVVWKAWLHAYADLRANRATPEEVRLLNRITPGLRASAKDRREFYYRYIVSPDWKKKADEAKRRAGYRCQVCNKSNKIVTLNTHHRTYENLGNEKSDDLTVLCAGCHDTFHKAGRLARMD